MTVRGTFTEEEIRKFTEEKIREIAREEYEEYDRKVLEELGVHPKSRWKTASRVLFLSQLVSAAFLAGAAAAKLFLK